MLGANHGFVQSVDSAAQIVDPYFARAIHELRSHSVRVHFNCACLAVRLDAMRIPCTYMACINLLASYIVLLTRPVVYP